MTRRKLILAAVACFSIALITGRTLSRAHASNAKLMRPFPPAKVLRGLTDEERVKAIEKWRAERENREKQHLNSMVREAWKRLLRVNEQQWAMMEPKIDKVYVLARAANVRAYGSQDDAGVFHWRRPSRPGGPLAGESRSQMPEQYRIVEDLIDLLEDKKSTDAQIKQKADALQQTREKARKGLAQLRRELGAVPMTPRQEAIFLIMGYVD
jgi:hypothetical protein